jgi:hypothetical protein
MRLLLALIALLGLATPATAQAADRRAHAVQCFLAMSAANGAATSATARDAARLGMLFFTAELVGMEPGIDLTAAARAELPGLTRAKVQALIPQCGAEMQAHERQIAAVGKGLKPAQGR